MNDYHDITRFPKTWGLLVFPISMSRIGNAQSAQACMDTLDHLRHKIQETKVGANFIYSEGLYMNFEEDPFETKNRFSQNSVSHMQAVKKLRQKQRNVFQIEQAFHFDAWFQMYLSHSDFFSVLAQVRTFYESDKAMQEYVALDAKDHDRVLDERQLAFYLEEFTYTYLLLFQQLTLANAYVEGREEWILEVYPGPAPRGLIYLIQKNPLTFETTNPYLGQYDSTKNHYIDFLKTDLEFYSAKY